MTGFWNLPKNSYIIFDVDGVLVDVSESYDEAVRQTVEQLLLRRGIRCSVNTNAIRALRNKGRFPQDYDLCTALLWGYSHYWSDREKMHWFTEEFPPGAGIEYIESDGTGMPDGKEIREIFDSLYTGNGEEGLWKKERSIADPHLMSLVQSTYQTAVITGRSRPEMVLAGRIIPFRFEKVITVEDFPKPDPRSIRSISGESAEGIYAGDTINDRKLVDNYNERFNGRFRFAHIGGDFADLDSFLSTVL